MAERVLFVCADPVGERMAGLGIRYWELARVLAGQGCEVAIAHGGHEQGTHEGIALLPFRPHAPSARRADLARASTIVTHPQWPATMRLARRSRARLVMDLYDPETLETLELFGGRRRRLHVALTLDRLLDALRSGHHFMCASEQQRDLWLGAMLGRRLLTPAVHDADPTLRSVIDVVPFGLPDAPPDTPPSAAPADDLGDGELVLWNGGIWGWLDAATAIRAVAALAPRRPGLRLLFMGGSTQPAATAATTAARALARELGLLDSVVRFHDGWVPYEQRAAWLLRADCALSTHGEHLESRYAFRTRLLDCFWSGLPVVCTGGDELATRVAQRGAGLVVPPGDVDATARALAEVLDRGRGAYAPALAELAAQRTWSRAAVPLVRWALSDGEPPARPFAPRPRPDPGERARRLIYRIGGRTLLARRRQ